MNTLRALFVHNDWARDRLLSCAVDLDDTQLDRRFDIGPGSLRATLLHIWHAERAWLDRWTQQATGPSDGADAPTIPALWERFRETAQEREAFLDALGPAGGAQRIEYLDWGGQPHALPLGDLVLHVCNHGAHHRAQAVHMLRCTAATIPTTDYLFMVMEEGPADTAFDVDTLAEYFRYGDWATEHVIALATGQCDSDLDRAREMGVGTLRKTLLHVHDTERWWLDNWLGRPSEQFSPRPDGMPLAELRDAGRETARKRNEYLACLADEDVGRDVVASAGADRTRTFRVGEAMVQLCGHGAHHRAQAMNMLRQDGVAVPRLDYVTWILEDAVD